MDFDYVASSSRVMLSSAFLYSIITASVGALLLCALLVLSGQDREARVTAARSSVIRVALPLLLLVLTINAFLSVITSIMAGLILIAEELIKLGASRVSRRREILLRYSVVASFAAWELLFVKSTAPFLISASQWVGASASIFSLILASLTPALMHLATAVIYSSLWRSAPVVQFMGGCALHWAFNDSRQLLFGGEGGFVAAYVFLDFLFWCGLLAALLLTGLSRQPASETAARN